MKTANTNANVQKKYRYRIELVTNSDVIEFNKIASGLRGDVMLVGENMKINAKSLLGTHLARISWDELYVETDFDSYSSFSKFII